MQIIDLKLQNFRNYDHLFLNFSPNFNLIYGNNGEGKTNLIESIYVLSLTRTFRNNNDQVLIKNNQEFTKINGTIKNNVTHNYEVLISNIGKKVKINNNLCHKLSEYVAKFKVVLFNPLDLQFIKTTPNIRRKSINLDITSYSDSYIILLSNYNKILKQRNAYLKTMYLNKNIDSTYLDILTNKIVDFGLKLYSLRKEYLDKINNYLSRYYQKITNLKDLKLNYVSDYDNKTKEEILKKYQTTQEKDMLFGKTQFGVHHDDFIFELSNNEIKDYGSEGQQKNAIISYKLSVIKLLEEKIKEAPILILDDLYSSLDKEKVDNILKILSKENQIFITTTDIDNISRDIKKKSKIFKIYNSSVEEVLE